MQITYLKQSNNHKKIKNYRNRNYQFDSSFYSTYFLTTTGILICKKENKFVIEYCSDDRIAAREYELV